MERTREGGERRVSDEIIRWVHHKAPPRGLCVRIGLTDLPLSESKCLPPIPPCEGVPALMADLTS